LEAKYPFIGENSFDQVLTLGFVVYADISFMLVQYRASENAPMPEGQIRLCEMFTAPKVILKKRCKLKM
jgi:hypothetical protein